MAEQKKASDLQRRRLKAGRLLQQGVHQSEVARRVGVSPEAVRKWRLKLEAEGLGALKIGAVMQGFPTELWTLPRIGALIQRLFGKRYSDSQVSRILAAMEWSCQRPTRRALQQDANAVAHWKAKRWPALKKTPEPSAG